MKFMLEKTGNKKRKFLKEEVIEQDDLVLNQIMEYTNCLEYFLDDIEEYVANRKKLLLNNKLNKRASEISDVIGCYLINAITAISNIEINASDYMELMYSTFKEQNILIDKE